jgi:nicotinate dehydrogenase subunit A
MAITIKLTVNGKPEVLHADDPNMPLLYALRDELGLHGLHFGCGLAQCGACTVHYTEKRCAAA